MRDDDSAYWNAFQTLVVVVTQSQYLENGGLSAPARLGHSPVYQRNAFQPFQLLPPRRDRPESSQLELDERFDDEFEERFDDELELELLDEFELEFDDEFEEEFEFELLDELELELDELLPARMMAPSPPLLDIEVLRRESGAGTWYGLASAVVVATAAMPATIADLNFQCRVVMSFTPCLDRSVPVAWSNGLSSRLFPASADYLIAVFSRSARSARASSSTPIGGLASIAAR